VTERWQLVVIGGGPAGIGAAVAARRSGLSRILILERDREAGGILNQCIHNGFGLHYFGQELTGPEYAGRLADQLKAEGLKVQCDTMVLAIEPGGTGHRIGLMSASEGYRWIESQAVILAMGCRERTRGAIGIPGKRLSGILTAGTAQRYVNMEGYMVGERVIVLGSGDIGLIMARRMTLEGAEVVACVELMPYSGGLARNLVQCLDDYDIPLLLSHTITRIDGQERVSGVNVQAVDQDLKPVPGTDRYFQVDTVLLSVGLIPENELTRAAGIEMDPRTGGALVRENKETSVRGIFACGNVLHVHDLVDYVTQESEEAGRAAAAYVNGLTPAVSSEEDLVRVIPGPGIAYTVPQEIRVSRAQDPIRLFFRVRQPEKSPRRILLKDGDRVLGSFRKPYMAPGEMEDLTLTRSLLEEIQGGQLEIALEEKEGGITAQ